MQIKDIKEPIVFIALKRICSYLINNVWSLDLLGGDIIEAEFKLVVAKSKEYKDDIEILAKIDTDLNWGQKKTFTDEKHWSISKTGGFNPWYSGNLSLEDLLKSIEPIVDFETSSDQEIQYCEFQHYYTFLQNYLNQGEDKFSLTFWGVIHPDIRKVSEKKYQYRDFADCVRAALVEIEDRVRTLCKQKTRIEYSGNDLMHHAFSPENPIIKLDDLSTISGKDIQRGYMEIFSGAMTGIRNPKSHKNFQIDEKRAIHFLFLASLLMSKLDEAIT